MTNRGSFQKQFFASVLQNRADFTLLLEQQAPGKPFPGRVPKHRRHMDRRNNLVGHHLQTGHVQARLVGQRLRNISGQREHRHVAVRCRSEGPAAESHQRRVAEGNPELRGVRRLPEDRADGQQQIHPTIGWVQCPSSTALHSQLGPRSNVFFKLFEM